MTGLPPMIQVAAPEDFAGFRATARALLADRVRPQDVTWAHEAYGQLFNEPAYAGRDDAPMPPMPRELVQLLEAAACYRFEGRWALMYRLLWRTRFENRALVRDAADADVSAIQKMAAAVRHDVHRMHAFLRFREVEDAAGPYYVAWYEPQHLVLDRALPFFVERFANLRWMIATPDGAASWDPATRELARAPAPPPGSRPPPDAAEDLWCTYFASVFNAARTNPRALARHLPKRWWKHLPEGREIERLLDDGHVARERLLAATPVPEDAGLRVGAPQLAAACRAVREAAAADAAGPGAGGVSGAPRPALEACRNCALWRDATQPVPGIGPLDARVMLVGEAPGDQEDLEGRPFVGPAGRVLDEALQDAGFARERVYLTNAVKHFAWEPRGPRRLHRKPAPQEVDACNGWLREEVDTVRPAVAVALGATALRALCGWRGSVRDARHEMLHTPEGVRVIATWHPAAILRAPEDAAQRMRVELVGDLVRAAREAEAHDADAGLDETEWHEAAPGPCSTLGA